MMTRWLIAAAGAIGVGVLTASALLGPTKHVEVPETACRRRTVSGSCDADKQANLDFTVKDMNNAGYACATTRAKSSW